MSKFQPLGFKIDSEQEKGEVRIVKLDHGATQNVGSFQLPVLEKRAPSQAAPSRGSFAKAVEGNQAQQNQPQKNQKDRRFNLSQLVRSHLSVEEEEQRLMEQRVAEQVALIEAEIKAKATEEGYQDGLNKGRQEAFEQFSAEGMSRMQRLEKVVSEIESAKEELFRANERYLLEMIYRIARSVLLKELSQDRDYLLRLVTELVHRVGVKENVYIRISQAEADTLAQLKDGLEKTFGALKNVTIETSSAVSEGGCLIETEWNAIDARIETQLKGIHEALLGKDTGGNA
jgi:flagellar assembly protein FliH